MTASELADLMNGMPGNTEVQVSLLQEYDTGRWVDTDSRLDIQEVLFRNDSRTVIIKVR